LSSNIGGTQAYVRAGRSQATTRFVLRIMPFCAELGQAAGIAIAMAKQGLTNARGVDTDALREELRKEGFVL